MTKPDLEPKYEGDYLEALDLDKPYSLVVAEVIRGGTEKDKSKKLITEAMLRFEKATKRLILNRTNYRVMVALFGNDRDKWKGQKVTVSKRYLKECFGKRNVLCVRILPPVGTALPMSVHNWMGRDHAYTDKDYKVR